MISTISMKDLDRKVRSLGKFKRYEEDYNFNISIVDDSFMSK